MKRRRRRPQDEPEIEPLTPAEERLRPRVRADCVGGLRPCPWVSCRHHLYLEVSEATGNAYPNFPDVEPEHIPETCSLDVADRGRETLEDTGRLLNLTRERIRQIEYKALVRLRLPIGKLVGGR